MIRDLAGRLAGEGLRRGPSQSESWRRPERMAERRVPATSETFISPAQDSQRPIPGRSFGWPGVPAWHGRCRGEYGTRRR